jgi:hypothetical protein
MTTAPPKYVRLQEHLRPERLTIADGMEVLRKNGFSDHDEAAVVVGALELPSGEVVGLPNLYFPSAELQTMLIVSLATSKHFSAVREGQPKLERFPIFQLDGAGARGDGTVELSNGEKIRAVTVEPARLPYAISKLDWRIIHQTISMVGAEARCYIHPAATHIPQLQEIARREKILDCSTLVGLNPPLLKRIQGKLMENGPDQVPSLEKISKTLRKFGIRPHGERVKHSSLFG